MSVKELDSLMGNKELYREAFSNNLKLFLPDEAVFTGEFIIQVNEGSKKLLPLSAACPPKLAQCKANKTFDRLNLICIVKRNNEMNKFLPDRATHKNVSREFLLAVSSYYL